MDGGIGEIFGTFSGWLKLTEFITTFISLILHRHGDHGNYLFFSTTAIKLNYQDTNIDAENLGNSTLVTFAIISAVLLLGYVMDGVEAIQDSILEPIWSLMGTMMFMGSGIMVLLAWMDEEQIDISDNATEAEYSRNTRAAMGLGSLCIITSIVYFIDFIWVMCRRGRHHEEYDEP